MPIFDLICLECDKKFDVLISNADKDKIICPDCGTGNVKQVLSPFNSSSSGGSRVPDSCRSCSVGGSSKCCMRDRLL
ncbi:MAG: zinc ribbon domain-containing protein [Syntrophomonadaceae bacterium]|nr:zinc ribbon domain-containing protein [Syntrophomonadaceae bacterium]MDD3888565.1 zinc ribbon domain-containing protein [Syntrophomonadaceae bacterium]MDD4548593.1 zinc ribbon domain-containing protein [Syntrophomonadaceae bacterium]